MSNIRHHFPILRKVMQKLVQECITLHQKTVLGASAEYCDCKRARHCLKP